MNVDYRKKLTDALDEYERSYRHFDYDAEADELYSLTKKQLERARTDSVRDALSRYARTSGMHGGSEAVGAAMASAGEYNAAIADALTQAELRAYERWKDERTALAERIDTLGQTVGADTSPTETGRGGNGMTESEYRAVRDRLLSEAKTFVNNPNGASQFASKITRIYAEIEKLDHDYYSQIRKYSPEEQELLAVSFEQGYAEGSLPSLTYSQYLALCEYYADRGGEQYLASLGVTYHR